MPIDLQKGPADISIHKHSGECHEELSGKYAEYIDANRAALVAKCERVNDCIKGMLEDENILLLLKGDNLSLNKTCGLIYDNNLDQNVDFGKCTLKDREDIREDLEEHLILQFEDLKASGWKNVRTCLKNNYGDTQRSTFVNDICKLAVKKPIICENRNIHRNVTTFFNNQIQHLQCTCRNLHKADNTDNGHSVPAIIAGLVGGLLIILIILGIIFICYRRRRKIRKSKKMAPNVIYLPAPNGDNYPVYQEVGDDPRYPANGKYPTSNPPALPRRYPQHIAGQEDENAYLEPVGADQRLRPKAPFPGKTNPNYGAPPEYSERDVSTADKDSGYFQPLPNPSEDRPGTENTSGYETIAAVLSSDDIPNPEERPQPPIPAKRSMTDRDETSRYVVLENDAKLKRLDSTV